jgi:hypothetical protein
MEAETTEDLWFENELLPELRKALSKGPFGMMISHPLVIDPFFVEDPRSYGLVNAQLRWKQGLLDKARAESDWGQVVFLHERPYRLKALLDYVLPAKPPKPELGELLGDTWADAEAPSHFKTNRDVWCSLFNHLGSSKAYLMDVDEIGHLGALPDTLRIYRGYAGRHRTGLSWTLDYDRARWFARRWGSDGARVATGTVEKSKVFALLEGRRESEIVVDPRHVKILKTEQVQDTIDTIADNGL